MEVFFHVDLDAFYASVEQCDHRELKGKPVIIGARPGTRGVVAACSYEARSFGIRSAMPISEAFRRCPDGVYLPPRMLRYAEVSRQVMSLLDLYSPSVWQVSIDEAFIDMTGTQRLFGSPSGTAKRLKKQVKDETGLTISIGIAPNRYLAKLASEYAKPDGIWQVERGGEQEFIDKLELRKLWGIGGKTLEKLEEYNITSIPKLRKFPQGALQTMMGKAAGIYLYKVVRGEDPGIYNEEPKSKSVSSEVTFPMDTRDRDSINRVLLDLSHQVMFRLMKEGFKSRTITVKIRFSDFSSTSVQVTLGHYVSSAEEIVGEAKKLLLKRWDQSKLLRLVGIGLSSIEKAGDPVQKELFQDQYDKKRKVEQAVLKIKNTISSGAVVKASLLKKRGN